MNNTIFRINSADAIKIVTGITGSNEFSSNKPLFLSKDLEISAAPSPFCVMFSPNEYFQLVKMLDEMPQDEHALLKVTYTGIGVRLEVSMTSGTSLDITDYSSW